jgi:hypothetical protein
MKAARAVQAFNCEDCQSKESYVDDQVTSKIAI